MTSEHAATLTMAAAAVNLMWNLMTRLPERIGVKGTGESTGDAIAQRYVLLRNGYVGPRAKGA
jgi:hypothetical protein